MTHSEEADAGGGQHQPILTRRRHWLGGFLLVVIAALGGYYTWYRLDGRYFESTDDAYVRANLVLVTPRIAGTVIAVRADDTQRVEAGQTLVHLDPLTYSIAANRAEAFYRVALSKTKEDRALLAQRQADLVRAKAALAYAKAEAKRRLGLFRRGMVSAESMAAMNTAVEKSRANVEASEQAVQAQLERLNGHPDRPASQQPTVRIAAEDLNMARYNLNYTKIRAPVSGIVAKRIVQLGEHVTPGQALMAIVETGKLWIDANFKETQLQHIRPGQRAIVRVDTYPGKVFQARVAGVGAGTGSAFAVLPAENATGNWVKVVQRVAVRVALENRDPKRFPLAVGMSVHVTVDTRSPSVTKG